MSAEPVIASDEELVADAVAARLEAEATEEEASPSRWREADRYAELSRRGWSTRRIGDACGVSHTTVRIHVRAVERYLSTENRPTFWTAYAEVTGEKVKSDAEFIVASNENEWYTPDKYLRAAREVLGAIDLDPASSETANAVVKAREFYTADQDGLSRPWAGRLWLNPPYGRLAGDFIGRLVAEHIVGNVTAAVALVNAHCTDTGWFQPLWDYTLCFTDHRIDFDSAGRDKTSTSTHGSVFAYLGDYPERFAEHFRVFGAVVERWSR